MVDIIVIALVLIVSLIGAKKGLISVVMKLVGLILAVVMSFYLYKGFAAYLYENFEFGKNIENTIVTTIKSKVVENVINIELPNDNEENIPYNTSAFFEYKESMEKEENKNENGTKISMDFSEVIETVKSWGLYNKVDIEENVVVDDEQAGKTIVDTIANRITLYIMRAIAFLAIFISVIVVTAIVSLVLTLLFMLPGLKTINKTRGICSRSYFMHYKDNGNTGYHLIITASKFY